MQPDSIDAEGSRDELLAVRCPECGEKTYYLIQLDDDVPRACVSRCPDCGFTSIAATGRLKWVEELMRETALRLKEALQEKSINASIELKVRLDPSGDSIRVRDTAFNPEDNPYPNTLFE